MHEYHRNFTRYGDAIIPYFYGAFSKEQFSFVNGGDGYSIQTVNGAAGLRLNVSDGSVVWIRQDARRFPGKLILPMQGESRRQRGL